MNKKNSIVSNLDNSKSSYSVEEKNIINSINSDEYNVYFEYKQFIPNEISVENIKKISQILANNPNIRITIKGFTDFLGKNTYNNKMAWQRAKVVQDLILKNENVSPSQLILVNENPKFEELHDPEFAKAMSRKVVFETSI